MTSFRSTRQKPCTNKQTSITIASPLLQVFGRDFLVISQLASCIAVLAEFYLSALIFCLDASDSRSTLVPLKRLADTLLPNKMSNSAKLLYFISGSRK